MKKTILIPLSILILLAAGTFIYYFMDFPNKDFLVTADELKSSDFLKDKQAVIYFTTRSDQDTDGTGVSYAIFVNKKGEAKGVEMNGLELGTVTKGKNNVFLEDKNTVRIIGDHYKEFPMKKDQYTGERSGYLEKQDMFYSIYNTGFNEKGGYNSDVRYGNEKGFRTGTIPHFLAASGQVDDRVYILAEDDESEIFDLKEVSLKNKLEVKQLTTIDTKDDPLSSVRGDKKYLYLIMGDSDENEQNAKVFLYRIDKQTYTQEKFTIKKYPKTMSASKTDPFDLRKSAYIYEDELYFVDGFGDVYTFHTKTEEIRKKFSFKDYKASSERFGELTTFANRHVYFYKYKPKTKKHAMETYDLKTGELVKQQEIKGITEMLPRRVFSQSYDFMVLKE